MTLEGFLKQNAALPENEKSVISERFCENGEAILWEYRAISSSEDETLRALSYKPDGELDTDKYMGLLASYCTVFPDLESVTLQDSYSVMGADNLLKAMLTPGEYTAYLEKIGKLNGFNDAFSDKVSTAKN